MLTFLLPPEIGERVTLVIESFLAMSFVVLMVSENVPVTSDSTPLIVKFLIMAMVEVGLTLLANCASLRLHKKYKVPSWIRVIFLHYVARMLCIKTESPSSSLPTAGNKREQHLELEAMKLVGATPLNNTKKENEDEKSLLNEEFVDGEERFLNQVSKLVNHELREEEGEAIRDFWIFTSRVCDRMFLVLFTACLIFSSSVIFSKVPDHFEMF